MKPFSASGGCAPRPLLPDSPITSVSGPGITVLLVTPLIYATAQALFPWAAQYTTMCLDNDI